MKVLFLQLEYLMLCELLPNFSFIQKREQICGVPFFPDEVPFLKPLKLLGEFSFTFEDVCVLLELPCFGKYNIYYLELYQEEKQIQDFFSDLFKSECERSNITWQYCKEVHKMYREKIERKIGTDLITLSVAVDSGR